MVFVNPFLRFSNKKSLKNLPKAKAPVAPNATEASIFKEIFTAPQFRTTLPVFFNLLSSLYLEASACAISSLISSTACLDASA